MSKFCTQCGTENMSEAKFCKSCGTKLSVTMDENQYKAPEQSEKPVFTYNGEIIDYASIDEFKTKYTFLSKNIVRDQSTWEDYSISIEGDVLYLYKDGKIVKAARINGLIGSEIAQGLDQVAAAENTEHEIGFGWWTGWAWIGLTLGNLMLFVKLEGNEGLALILAVINTIQMVEILRFNKYAFLTATVLSLNPLLWIINGIYLKNRWNHPKVNKENPL